MLGWSRLIVGSILRLFRSRGNLLLENLVLRQQLAVLKRRHRRPNLSTSDKLFWVFIRRLWKRWHSFTPLQAPDNKWLPEFTEAAGASGTNFLLTEKAGSSIYRTLADWRGWSGPSASSRRRCHAPPARRRRGCR